jgi:hypothetical protein
VAFLLFKKTFYAIIKKYYYTVFQLKKEFNKSCLVLYICFILVTWSLLQISLQTFFENNDNRLMKIPSIYAQDDGGVNGNGGGDGDGGVFDDNGGRDVEELGLDKENIPDEDIGQEDDPEQLTLSEDGRSEIQARIQQDANDVIEELTLEDSQDEDVDVSIFDGGDPSGTNINSQQPPGDPLSPLFVSLPPPPAGPLPPGGLPPIPGSPLPPGSPIPPGGGPTPPEDLPPSPQLQEQFPEKQEPSPQLREKFQQSSNIEFKSYENKNLGASFNIPVNWKQQQTPSPNEEIVFAEPNGKATLTIKVINASGVTIFEAASDFISGLKEGSSQTQNVYLNNIGIQNLASNNQESSKIISYTFGKDPSFSILQGVTYITLNNNKAYIANFVTDVQNFESYNLIMQRILSSFEILSDVSIDRD